MSKVIGKVSDVLFGRVEQPDIPEPEIPAVAAPTRREDTGASVVVGSDASKNQRVSGGGTSTTTGDVLGNLGKGGLSI